MRRPERLPRFFRIFQPCRDSIELAPAHSGGECLLLRVDLFRCRCGLETDPMASFFCHVSQVSNQRGPRNPEQACGLALVAATLLVNGLNMPPQCAIQRKIIAVR